MRSVTYPLVIAVLASVGQFTAASAQTPPAESQQTPQTVPQTLSPAARVQTPPTESQQTQQSLQTVVPQAQSPAETSPVASVSNQKLDAAAAAMQRMANLKRDYLQLLEDASPEDQRRIANEANYAIEQAIIDRGLSIEEFAAIVEMAQNDPQVRQNILERMQEPAK